MSGMRNTTAGLLIVAGFLVSTAAPAESTDAIGMGTWTLNPAQSSFKPGPAPQGLTTSFEAVGTGVKWTSQRQGPDGKPMTTSYTGSYDGKEYPVTGSSTTDMVVLRRIDAHTTERINKKDGKVVSTELRTVAKDNKSYTTTVTGMTAKGEPIDTRMVFDRK